MKVVMTFLAEQNVQAAAQVLETRKASMEKHQSEE
jgi:hypothetical protein